MPTNHHDVDGTISVTDFSILPGTAALSSDKQSIVISYTGYSYPERTDVAISTYEYSLDNGTTWSSMTTSSTITGLTFSEDGTAHTFEWEAKADEGMDFYNTNIRVRFNATSGSDETGLTYTSYIFEREVTNLSTAAEDSPFPDSYGGLSGSDLLKMAPKLS